MKVVEVKFDNVVVLKVEFEEVDIDRWVLLFEEKNSFVDLIIFKECFECLYVVGEILNVDFIIFIEGVEIDE